MTTFPNQRTGAGPTNSRRNVACVTDPDYIYAGAQPLHPLGSQTHIRPLHFSRNSHMGYLPTIVSSCPIFTGSCYPHPAMAGLVGLSARQPPSSILGPGKDTREPLETAIEPDDTQAMSPQCVHQPSKPKFGPLTRLG
ncbi:hypothetical protein IWW34DRAFT_227863 [Fusarium oxysporum f. sp. albedinis]|nr:hypothetical protein IWW34DRAFT_227863 [Fusarium oxysporum f. sp. albedinis]